MFSYVKSLMAVGLALLVVIGAGVWMRSRSSVLKTLEKETRDQKKQIAEAKSGSAIISQLEKRLEVIRRDIEKKAVRLSARDEEGLRLIQAVVKAAAASGMEMTGVAEAAKKGKVYQTDDTSVPVNVITYEISLEGTYAGLVKFFQNIDAWELEKKVEALEISSAKNKDAEVETEGGIKAEFILSIFSID